MKLSQEKRIYENDQQWSYKKYGGINKRFKLFEHQINAIKWMRQVENIDQKSETIWPLDSRGVCGGILSLDLGLGKTLCTIAHSLFAENENLTPDLIVCSKSVLYEWQEQFLEMFERRIPVLFYHKHVIGEKAFNSIDKTEIRKYRFIVTTYDVLITTLQYIPNNTIVEKDHRGRTTNTIIQINNKINIDNIIGPKLLFYIRWERFITDESHTFVNSKTKKFKAVMNIHAKYKWCLTGTPYKNCHDDICSLYRFLGYIDPYFEGDSMTYLDWKSILKKQKFDKYIFKMSVKDANIILPNKIEKTIEISFDTEQACIYSKFQSRARQTYLDFFYGNKNYASVFTEIMRLRQLCIAPYMVLPESKRNTNYDGNTNQIIHEIIKDYSLIKWLYNINGTAGILSPKIKKAIDIIKNISSTSKAIIFSSFTSCLDLIKLALKNCPIKYVTVDGSVLGDERKKAICSFKTDPNIRLLLTTYKTGSEGLNLTCANHVLLMDAWWTFVTEDQAIGRVYRMGQRKIVTIYRFYAKDGIENISIRVRANEKKRQASDFLEGAVGNSTKKLSKTLLRNLLYG